MSFGRKKKKGVKRKEIKTKEKKMDPRGRNREAKKNKKMERES